MGNWILVGQPASIGVGCFLLGLVVVLLARRSAARERVRRRPLGIAAVVAGLALLALFFGFNAVFHQVTGG